MERRRRDPGPDPAAGGARHLLIVGVRGSELAAGGLPPQVEVGQPVQEAHPPGRRVADPGHGGPAPRRAAPRGLPRCWRGLRDPPTPAWSPASPARSWARPGPARPGSAALGSARPPAPAASLFAAAAAAAPSAPPPARRAHPRAAIGPPREGTSPSPPPVFRPRPSPSLARCLPVPPSNVPRSPACASPLVL